MQILLVDDDEDITMMLAFSIQKLGHKTSLAATGKEALESIQKEQPGLIIMDINIPDPSGTEVCKQLKGDANLSSIPIILLTGDSTVSKGEADALILKPYEWPDLQKEIEKLSSNQPGNPP